MILNKLWERYFFKEVTKVFLLFLFLFFLFYALTEYSIHLQDFTRDKNLKIFDLLAYFAFQFIKRAPLLVPLGLLVATIKSLCTANARGELVALQSAGIGLKVILRPFFLLGTLCLIFNVLNTQFILPRSLTYLDTFKNLHFRGDKGVRKDRIQVLYLKDNSKLIYQTFDKKNHLFKDVIWVISVDDIWRMKTLNADPHYPLAQFADHIQRTEGGILEKTASFETHLFSTLKWDSSMTNQGFIPVENKTPTTLFKLLKQNKPAYEKSEILTQLLHKCTLPFLSLLVVLGVAPYCVRYSRGIPVFFIYSVALFAFLSIFALFNAAVILGENHTLSPFVAVLAPFSFIAALCLWKFFKTCK